MFLLATATMFCFTAVAKIWWAALWLSMPHLYYGAAIMRLLEMLIVFLSAFQSMGLIF